MGIFLLVYWVAGLLIASMAFVSTRAAGYFAAALYLDRWYPPRGRRSRSRSALWAVAGVGLDLLAMAAAVFALGLLSHARGNPRWTGALAWVALFALRGAAWAVVLHGARAASEAARDVPHWVAVHAVVGAAWSSLLDLVAAGLTLGAVWGLARLLSPAGA